MTDLNLESHFIVRIVTNKDGMKLGRLIFDADKFGSKNDINETDQIEKTSESEETSETSDEKASSPSNDETIEKNGTSEAHLAPELPIGDKFEELGREWTETAITFFEIVPEISLNTLQFATDSMTDSLEEFAKKVADKSDTFHEDNETIDDYLLMRRDLTIVAKTLGKTSNKFLAADRLIKSSLGSLLSEFEVFMYQLMILISEVRPDAILTKDDTFEIGELDKFDSIEEARKAMLSDKIEDFMHNETYLNILKWLEGTFGINLTSDKKLILEFSEICQRRHLMTHAGGVVNTRYLKLCKDAGWAQKDLPKLGESLTVDNQYLRRATSRVYQIGFFTLHIIWQKLLKVDEPQSCSSMISTSHDFLESGLTKMCERTCNFALKSSSNRTSFTDAALTINLGLSVLLDKALSEDDRQSKVNEIIDSRDWTMINATINLALACLKRDFSNIGELSIAAKKEGNIGYYEASTWLIFDEARELEDFQECFLQSA